MPGKAFEYFMPPVSILGRDCLKEIPRYIKPMRFRKALIVSDKVLVDIGLISSLTSVLEESGIFYIIYDNVSPNPTVEQVDYGLRLFQDNGCDFLISFGGGSPHDCAKGIALLATNGGSIHDYVGLNQSKAPSAPLIAVNTTAGTGSELTRFCVITDEKQHKKMTITDWHVTPIVAVSDACLMTAMPPGLTAATGLDALTHAVEAYVSTQATPVTDCKALKAIELIAKNLPTAVVDGQDLDAREGMVYAEYLAGIAFNNASLGYVHAAAHQLGGRYGLPHGLANALMLPAVTDFNLIAIPKRYADIARAMGQSIAGLSTADAARLAPAAMRSLIETLGTPQHLRDVRGFNEEDIPLLAAGALEDITGATNLRRATQEEMEAIFRAVL